jgi:hypothetical protein
VHDYQWLAYDTLRFLLSYQEKSYKPLANVKNEMYLDFPVFLLPIRHRLNFTPLNSKLMYHFQLCAIDCEDFDVCCYMCNTVTTTALLA